MISQLKILYHLTLSPVRGETHAERLDSFYGGQADGYDDFRKRMLHGRDELFAELPVTPGGVWVDLGAGTGENATRFGDRLAEFGDVRLVDLSESLLGIAKRRVRDAGWSNVRTLHADVTQLDSPACKLPDNSVDLVTFTYSLTMVPDWFAALAQAERILKPGGTIGVVDFFVSRKWPAEGRARHSFFTRSFWPVWFSMDNVHPSADHLPFLCDRFMPQSIHESYGKLPWLPIIRAPHYRFVGTKRA
ncbi:MAG: class I SAM-dependent methyltransferase [Planctomycetota bacterium]